MDDQRTDRAGGDLLIAIGAKLAIASLVFLLLWMLSPVLAVLVAMQAPFMFLAWRYLPKTDRQNDDESNLPQK